MIEAVYIVDINGHVLLEYPVHSTPPALSTLLPHVVPSDGSEPLLSNIVELSSTRLLFHKKYGTVIFILPCTSSIPALVPFEFVNRLVDVLEVYFSPPLIPMKIESHRDTTTLILNEMLEDGLPCMTDPDPMRDLVPYGGLITKFLGSSSSTTSKTNQTGMTSTPWRRQNVRHTNNELFVDVVETIHAVMTNSKAAQLAAPSAFYSSSSTPSNSKPIVCRTEGAVFLTSHLSGVPEIQLQMDFPNHKDQRQSPSFHQCIDLQRWKQNPGMLSFVPPDGKTLLASYTIESSGSGLVYADLRTGLGVQRDEFEVRVGTLVAREVKHVDQLVVQVVCDPNVISIKGMRVTAGDFHISEGGLGEWRFPGKTPLGWNATLRGVLNTANNDDEDEEPAVHFPKYLKLNYSLMGQVPSGTKVGSLRVVSSRGMGDGVKPYKGVRYSTRIGEYVVR